MMLLSTVSSGYMTISVALTGEPVKHDKLRTMKTYEKSLLMI
jgi:hypothetical protein